MMSHGRLGSTILRGPTGQLPTCVAPLGNLCVRYISTGDEEDVSEEDEEEEEEEDDDGEDEEEGDEKEEAEANGAEGKPIHLCEHGKTKARVRLASRVAPPHPDDMGY